MTVVLDTSVLVDLLRGHEPAGEFVESLTSVPVCSEITRVEVLRGLRSSERSRTNDLFDELRWISLDAAIGRRAGNLGRTWRGSHPGLSSADLVIAATAEHVGGELATGNVRHFPMFEGLAPPYA